MEHKGFFPATKGLRQGDPLSPFLFILVADSLPQILNWAENIGILKGFQVGRYKVNVSYLQFADDTLILLEGEEDMVSILKSIIKCFGLVSGFKVNWIKANSQPSNFLIRKAFLWEISLVAPPKVSQQGISVSLLVALPVIATFGILWWIDLGSGSLDGSQLSFFLGKSNSY